MGMAIFASCSDSNQPDDPKPVGQSHTLLFYFMGNETGLTDFMDDNILDIRTAATKIVSEDQHIAIFYDNGSKTQLTEYVKNEEGRTVEKVIHQYINTSNCIKPEFIADVLQMVKDSCATDTYSIVFSSHGGGWVPSSIFDGYLADASTQSALTASPFYCGQDGELFLEIPDMAEALDMSGIHFDYILFDACYMSSIEALYELRENADYIIASPVEVLAYGFPYKDILPMLFTDNHSLEDVCKAYIDSYQSLTGNDQSAVIALTDCSKLDALADATKAILASAGSVDASKIQGYEGFTPNLYYDFEQYAQQLYGGELAAEFKAAMDAAFPYSAHTAQFYTVYGPNAGLISLPSSCGVSCYIPDPTSSKSHIKDANAAYLETSWAKAIGLK